MGVDRDPGLRGHRGHGEILLGRDARGVAGQHADAERAVRELPPEEVEQRAELARGRLALPGRVSQVAQRDGDAAAEGRPPTAVILVWPQEAEKP
nr:hypothetical protein GCM10020093_013830 [Planobispora longispora]